MRVLIKTGRRHWALAVGAILLGLWAGAGAAALHAAGSVLTLNADNPHYFEFHNRPTVLIGSTEHYGAVLNLDFNEDKYLATVHADGLNVTRTFSGAYVEPQGAFRIAHNTLAPARNRFICPWARSSTPGYVNGGNKFDLNRWDPAYFRRLRHFVSQAAAEGVVVEMNLFCPFYGESQWHLSPMNAINNVNGLGKVARTNVYTLDRNGGLLVVQEAMVRKIVGTLKDFGNVYYEICNEPYFGGVTLAWQRHIARLIADTERSYPIHHLISRNVANGKAKIVHPFPEVSIYNFHYAYPPATVGMNYGLEKVIGDNETGFRGTNDFVYRREAWAFFMAGGGLYDNLDYSFTAGHEDGTFHYPSTQPGGGTPALRHELGILKNFMGSIDFIRMKPDQKVLKGDLEKGVSVWVLGEPGRQYAAYLCGGKQGRLMLDLPKGRYRAEWINPLTGAVQRKETVTSSGGASGLSIPQYRRDIALRLRVAGKGL